MNRVTADECLGRPAVEVLGWLQDNGLKSVFLNKEVLPASYCIYVVELLVFFFQRWEGDYTIDKRLGSSQHQRLSLLPVKNPRGVTVNYVSIQRIQAISDTIESPKPRMPPANCSKILPFPTY